MERKREKWRMENKGNERKRGHLRTKRKEKKIGRTLWGEEGGTHGKGATLKFVTLKTPCNSQVVTDYAAEEHLTVYWPLCYA